MKRNFCILLSVLGAFALLACMPTFEPPGGTEVDEDAGYDADHSDDVGDPGQDDVEESGCDPQIVCEDYCHEKYTRCLDANCGGGFFGGFGNQEHQLCMDGLDTQGEDGQPETLIEGCVERASQDDEACEEIRDDIEIYEQQSCDSDEQRHRQCQELKLFLTMEGPLVFEMCGCQPAATAESCEEDSECSHYDDGVCATEGVASECTAECHQHEGVSMPLLPDPSCADQNGVCLHLGETYSDLPDGPTSLCQKYCTSRSDCPDDGSCVPMFRLQDDGVLGLCTTGALWDLEYDLCQGHDDCSPGTGCYEGTCQPACDGSDAPCELGQCGSDGICEVNFQHLF